MYIFRNQKALKQHLKPFLKAKKSIGFVPTMGALHDGHLSLVEKSISENAITVVSIFVNPTQFNNAEDLAKYPRTIERDTEKIESLSKDIIIFAPSVDDIYGNKAVSLKFDYDGLENQMEGKHRPGHFDGVGTIVKKLFEIVQPKNAYFGEKDFQQLQIVKKMVEKENLDVTIIGRPIFREKNGLAMSSRNERLSKTERAEAKIIYKTLQTVQEKFGTNNALEISAYVKSVFEGNDFFKLEYFEIADEATLVPANTFEPHKKYRAFIAVFAGNVRLIDTVSLN
ncbi:pantoate--beta-alanine ligase [Flavobacterium sp. NST-5]|uniref:Pantothenate synthetase n=1 Tax=Flavobacterium ichthyis TaxID=2698827 RepID=A0ABW9ZD02_9FLAO|nr:pantoate--beta-alanine ligase [Flavobacterium ichthyis]NBL64965.1 pantoate--beta-alanine ligase [Flavobacterium ichthyis]